jgi:hypothetical protein
VNDSHQQFEELAAGWALHALEPVDEARFTAHLPTCAQCQQMVADLTDTLTEVAYAAPESAPPPQLRDRIMRAALATDELADLHESTQVSDADRQPPGPLPTAARLAPASSGPADNRPSRGPVGRRRRLPWVLTAAAVVVALLLGGWNVVLQEQQRGREQVAAQQQDLIRQLVRPGSRLASLSTPAGKPVAYVLSSNGQLELLTDGMAANQAGSTSYWLWAVLGEAGSAPQPVARFDVTGTDLAVHHLGKLPANAADAAAFAVSIEPGQARPTKPTTVLANGTVAG